MPRFVLLEHDWPARHWDLMLEYGSVLRSWRLAAPPRQGERFAAVAVFDHRLLYLDYEGPISGDRGRVVRWDRGTFAEQARDERQFVVRLQGERLCGTLRLRHEEGDTWAGEFAAETNGERGA
jgi:hypothetical protein